MIHPRSLCLRDYRLSGRSRPEGRQVDFRRRNWPSANERTVVRDGKASRSFQRPSPRRRRGEAPYSRHARPPLTPRSDPGHQSGRGHGPASSLSYDQIAHATPWYLREETLVPAIGTVVDHHHGLPAARWCGYGTFSSSDGQRFPVQVQAANAVVLPRYFGLGRGITGYTWVSDHYATYATKVVETSLRDATFVLDGIFVLEERGSVLDIAEHTTDTAGYTDLVFAVFDLVGLKFSPGSATSPTSACGAWTAVTRTTSSTPFRWPTSGNVTSLRGRSPTPGTPPR